MEKMEHQEHGENPEICLHVWVSGRVQGVWFRQFARETAEANGIGGWVRNLADGRVEAMLCGNLLAVRHVEAWLQKGPELALVAELESELEAYQGFEGFEVRADGL